MFAAESQDQKLVERLLFAKADPTIKNEKGLVRWQPAFLILFPSSLCRGLRLVFCACGLMDRCLRCACALCVCVAHAPHIVRLP